MNLPDYEFLPAPVWLLTLLHIVTLTLHFIAMNFMLGGVIVVLFGRFEDRWQNPTVQTFVKLFPSVMAATVSFGVAPLLFLQVVYHRQVYAASIVSGWFWLLIIGAAIISYYLFYSAAFSSNMQATERRGFYLMFACAGLLYISIVYSSVFSMAENPELYKRLYAAAQSGLIINPQIGDWILRWLHMVLGALTVGGFFVGLLGRDDPQAFAVGKKFFLYGLAANSVVGLAYLFTLGETLTRLMGTAAIWFLTLSIILSLGSLHMFFKRKFLPASLMLFVSVVGMVVTRHSLRVLFLEGHVDPAQVPVRSQWDVFLLFLVCFLAAIGLIAWMLIAYFRSADERTV